MTLRQTLLAMLVCVLMAVGIAEVYALVSTMRQPQWLAIAIFNSAATLLLLPYLFKYHRHLLGWSVADYWAWAPAAAILGGSVLLATFSRQFGEVSPLQPGSQYWAWILWIPVVEEVVFRGGIGSFLRGRFGLLSGAWFSACLFALVHANPTLENVLSGNIGLPLGPFLLGLLCELLVWKTARLWPAILLHGVCNATPVIFQSLDPRWLDWLDLLYL